MGEVVDFPGIAVDEGGVPLNVQDASYLIVVDMDQHFYPVYSSVEPDWYGAMAVFEQEEQVGVRLHAAFLEKSEAIEYATSKHEDVEMGMPDDMVTQMRLRLAGMTWVPEDCSPPEGDDAS